MNKKASIFFGSLVVVGALVYVTHYFFIQAELRGCKKAFLDIISYNGEVPEESMPRLLTMIEKQCLILL